MKSNEHENDLVHALSVVSHIMFDGDKQQHHDIRQHQLHAMLIEPDIDHKSEILKEINLKQAHVYCKLNKISGSISGGFVEYYIQKTHRMTKNKKITCNGDLNHNNVNYEIKISNGGKTHNVFNYVQIRVNHDCDYIFTAYYLNLSNYHTHGELFVFKLCKSDIKQVILNHGYYAHGTFKKLGIITSHDLNDTTNTKEYCLRVHYNDRCWKTLLFYRIDETLL